jgi:DNA-3-methyladenine glycosylase
VSGFPTDLSYPSNGPGKLCRSMEIDKSLNGISLQSPQLMIATPAGRQRSLDVRWSSRIGVTAGADRLWRAYIFGNSHVSRKSNAEDPREPDPFPVLR